jgi:hypothetical protein
LGAALSGAPFSQAFRRRVVIVPVRGVLSNNDVEREFDLR